MQVIEHELYSGYIESYTDHDVESKQFDLALARDSTVLSILSIENQSEFKLCAYIEIDPEEKCNCKKVVTLVATGTAMPVNNGVGWRFLNSVTIQLNNKKKILHAYVRIC